MGGSPRMAPRTSRMMLATLVGRRRTSATFVRLTFAGPDLDVFVPLGGDQWFRLLLPAGDDPGPHPTLGLEEPLARVEHATGQCALIRNYTVAEFRPREGEQAPELDVDVVVTDSHSGPGVRFARDAPLGSLVGIVDAGRLHSAVGHVTPQLFVGDESALPGILGILRGSPADISGLAVLEVPHADDVTAVDAPPGLEVRWIVRGTDDVPGEAARAAVPTRSDWAHCYLAGPSSMVTQLRRELVAAGVDRELISFTGFWLA